MSRRVVVYGFLGLLALATVAIVVIHAVSDSAYRPEPRPFVMADDTPHLTPDARVLMAVGELAHLTTGESYYPAVAEFDSLSWRVLHGAREVGSLPEYPDFGDVLALLEDYARTLPPLAATVAESTASDSVVPPRDAEIDRLLDHQDALLAANEVDRRWAAGDRSPALVQRAARSLVQLQLGTTDLVGVADRVSGRALALLALARRTDPGAMAHETVLLSASMGYGGYAWNAARSLPDDDPARLYVQQRDRELQALARSPQASEEARFLTLRRLAQTRDITGWQAWLGRAYPGERGLTLPVLSTSLELGGFETHTPAAKLVLAATAAELHLLDRDLPVATLGNIDGLALLLHQFERLMAAAPAGSGGPIADMPLVAAYFRANFYSAIWLMGEHIRVALSSREAARDFANGLADVPPGPAQEFAQWYRHLATHDPALREDLENPTTFGAMLRYTTFREMNKIADGRAMPPRYTARILLAHVDGRPANRFEAGIVGRMNIRELEWAESLLVATARQSRPNDPVARAWWARMTGDRAAFDTLLVRDDMSPVEEELLLSDFARLAGSDTTAVSAAYGRSLHRHPDSWVLVHAFARYAIDVMHDYPLARATLQGWLRRHREEDMDRLIASLVLASTFEKEGRYTAALAVSEPLVGTQQFGIMQLTAELYDRLGRGADAETLAVAALERYAGSAEAVKLIAEIFWRHGRSDELSAFLASLGAGLGPGQWRWQLGTAFTRAFRDHPDEIGPALDALIPVGLDTWSNLEGLAQAADAEGHSDLAWEIMKRAHAPKGDRALVVVDQYQFARHARGVEAAWAWLEPRLSDFDDRELSFVSYMAFGKGEYDLLWRSTPRSDPESVAYQWLLRAAAARIAHEQDPERLNALRRRFARGRHDRYHTMGRYLLGLEDEHAVQTDARTAKTACEASYFFGVRAQGEGRYADAARWYRRCLDTNATHNAEYGWAGGQLAQWAGLERTLRDIAADERDHGPHAPLVPVVPADEP